jgi:RimJ/RimL family protein N-acetyltransferase
VYIYEALSSFVSRCEMTFAATDRFDVDAMASFMRRPEIYWPASDCLAPPPEAMRFEEHLVSPHVWTIAATYQDQIIGYVQFIQKTTIGAEIHTGFHPKARGKVAKTMIEYAIAMAFRDRGLTKLWGIIASDNKPALMMAASIGFHREGRLTNSIVRKHEGDGPPLSDLILVSLEHTRRSH